MWSNLWAKNNGFFFPPCKMNKLFRTFNVVLEPTSPLVLITDTSFGIQMSDHEMLRLNNALYFAVEWLGMN